MPSELTLEKLVASCLSRELSERQFVVHLERFLHKNLPSDNEIAESLLELHGKKLHDKRVLQLRYVLAYASTSVESLHRFFDLLRKTSLESQKDYLGYLKRVFKDAFQVNLREFINKSLHDYTSGFQGSLGLSLSKPEKAVFVQLIFLWGAIIQTALELINQSQFQELAIAVITKLHSVNENDLANLFSKHANAIVDSADLRKDIHKARALVSGPVHFPNTGDKSSPASIKKALLLNLNLKKVLKFYKLKKFMWLNHQLALWRLAGLVDNFIRYFEIQTASTVALLNELIGTFFDGFISVSNATEKPYVVFNWRSYIVSRLPRDIESVIKKSESEASELENDVISIAMATSPECITHLKVGGWERQPCDLRRTFLRACLYRGVISLAAYTNTFPDEKNLLSSSLVSHEVGVLSQVHALASDYHAKLTDVNTEFTSLLESKLVEYFASLPNTDFQYSPEKQAHLLKLVQESMDSFMKNKEFEKLCRLVLALLNNPPLANYIFFVDTKGPWTCLEKLIPFIDAEEFSDEDDESNFQESYSHFGILLSSVIMLADTFGVDFASTNITSSYTVDFINNYFYRLLDNYTDEFNSGSDQDTNFVGSYKRVTSEWANALFDVNNEGLSDDLIKSIGVKQIYKLIVIILQKAVIAALAGKLDSQNLYNGIDYLSQEFLVHCAVEFSMWLASNIGPLHNDSEYFAQLILKIIQSNLGEEETMGEKEIGASFTLVLNLIGTPILKNIQAIRNWEANETMAKLVKVISENTNSEYGTSKKPLLVQNFKNIEGNSTVLVLLELLALYLHEKTDVDAAALLSAISAVWSNVSDIEIIGQLENLLQCLLSGSGSRFTLEETKIMVNFLSFLISLSGSLDVDKAQEDLSELRRGIVERQMKAQEFSDKFTTSLSNHYASALGEINVGENGTKTDLEPKTQPKEDLGMDFEMDDLFNDMSEGFFTQSNPLVSQKPSRSSSPTLDVHKTMESALQETSLIRRLGYSIQNDPFSTTQHKDALKAILLKELEHTVIRLLG